MGGQFDIDIITLAYFMYLLPLFEAKAIPYDGLLRKKQNKGELYS